MDEDKNTQPTEDFHPTDAEETLPETQQAQPKFAINIFQTARVHTERVAQEFDTREEAEAHARELCKEKGIDPDFEIEEVPVPVMTETPVLENAVEQAEQTNEQ